MKFKKNDKVVIVKTNDLWENKKGKILADFNDGEITDETKDYLVKVYFDGDRFIIQTFNEANLELIDVVENINESKKMNTKDFIHDYVYLNDLDEKEIPSWFFIDRLSTAENITNDAVIEAAKKLNYKLFMIKQNQYKKIIVAAPKCEIDTIYDEYANHLLGFAEVIELPHEKEK